MVGIFVDTRIIRFTSTTADRRADELRGQAERTALRGLAEAVDTEALEGGRKTVTALFADIKGSIELMEDLGP
jgi:class 3 adenylate cyclase